MILLSLAQCSVPSLLSTTEVRAGMADSGAPDTALMKKNMPIRAPPVMGVHVYVPVVG